MLYPLSYGRSVRQDGHMSRPSWFAGLMIGVRERARKWSAAAPSLALRVGVGGTLTRSASEGQPAAD
jgi:hypothetical protein